MKEELRDEISLNLNENVDYIKGLLKYNSDVIYREFYTGSIKAAVVYIDSMADRNLINDFIIENFMYEVKKSDEHVKDIEYIENRLISASDIKKIEKLSEGIDAFLAGETLLMFDGFSSAYIIATRSWPTRGISEPSSENVLRGARDGFTETIRFNTVLVRRRIRDTRLRIKAKKIGTRSKTDIAILYIDDIVNRSVLEEVEKRLDKINIDAIFDSGYIEQLIEDDSWSLFPQMQNTERPDVVSAALYEGKVAILVDNSPSALIAPGTLISLFQSPDDYYQRWISSSIIRLTRVIGVFISMILPALYVAITSFETSIIPTKLAYSIAASRENVPFPAFIEAMIMEISLALLMEAVVRLPKPIGATIGIVGGLIIGQAAVSAGIVSPIMIIIISMTAITSFIMPNYEITNGMRIIRFLLIIIAAIFGLYGIIIGLIIIGMKLIKMRSFGIPYLAPLVDFNISDIKDALIRVPIDKMKTRPKYMKTQDKVRQR